MDLLSFEQKLDATIVRKRLDIQEALKRPQKIKRKLRIFISHTFFPGAKRKNAATDKHKPTIFGHEIWHGGFFSVTKTDYPDSFLKLDPCP